MFFVGVVNECAYARLLYQMYTHLICILLWWCLMTTTPMTAKKEARGDNETNRVFNL